MSCSTHPVGCGRRARGIVWKYLNWKLLGITAREIQHTRVLLSSTAHALVLTTDLWAGPRWGWRCIRCPWWGWRCRRGGDCWCPRGSPPGSGHPPAAARTARRENLAGKYFYQHCKYFYNLLLLTRNDPADGGARPAHAGDDDEAEALVLEPGHGDVVGVAAALPARAAFPVTLCREYIVLTNITLCY